MTKNTINVININLSTRDVNAKPIQLNITETTTAEDVIIEICKVLKIKPVTRQLFGLKNISLSPNAWLSLSSKVSENKIKKHFEFALRFNVPDLNRLRYTDVNAYNYYYNQARQSILQNTVQIDVKNQESDVTGLCVVDIHRAVLEKEIQKDHVCSYYRNYIPNWIKKKHPIFLRKAVCRSYDNVVRANVDAWFIKKSYLDKFKKVVPNYLVEEFNLLVSGDDGLNPYSAIIRVNPFDQDQPGISMKESEKQDWQHICTIEDLCFISMRHNGTVEMARKNGISMFLKFSMVTDMMSFVTLLDGYYRLIAKWTFNLCGSLPTPSLTKLWRLKCHGPVSEEFAYRKLAVKANNAFGHFILRESYSDYDSYYVDVCTKPSSKPTTFKIEKTNDGQYRIANQENSYPSLFDLIKAHRSQTATIPLVFCLPPSEYEQSNLLLCKATDSPISFSSGDDVEPPKASPILIDVRSLMTFKSNPLTGQSTTTTVYPGFWKVDNNNKMNVVVKILKSEDQNVQQEELKEKLPEFLSSINRWAFVNTSSAVKLLAVTVQPVCMVMEHYPLGPLDTYLAEYSANPKSPELPEITEVNLVEACTYLANALYYLAEAKIVHGNIRCRKLLVSRHTSDSFVVKLSDPGLGRPYSESDLYWIPPEHHVNSNAARKTVKSDVWAFATTLWEIFSYGTPPVESDVAARTSYCHPHMYLSKPDKCPRRIYDLMTECWYLDPQVRKTPQEIMRDTNQIFYQIYNHRTEHQYAVIKPSLKYEADNISNDSKTSADYSASDSQVTALTFADGTNATDDGESEDAVLREVSFNSAELSLYPSIPKHEGDYEMNCLPGYPLLMDQIELQSNEPREHGDSFNSISSMLSAYELDKEYSLVFKGLIGDGQFGQVYKGDLFHHYDQHKDPMKVAVKKLKIGDSASRAELSEEIMTMVNLDHPNIVKVIGRLLDPELCLVLEYMENGSLKSYVRLHKPWMNSARLLKFALDIAKGMEYLCKMKIVHRDLAARNILVGDNIAKISDFGLARMIGNNNYYYYSKPDRSLPIKWYAPESIEHAKFSFQSDVWSYGVTLWEMFSDGEDPNLVPPEDDNAKLGEMMCEQLKMGTRLKMPLKCPQHVYNTILRACWSYEASQRPTFSELCKKLEDFFLNLRE